MVEERNRVCPVELAGSLDSKWRSWIHNPQKILRPYVTERMSVLDIGCGPGYFSIAMAKMVGVNGKVFAVDLQEGMLKKIENKIRGNVLEEIIELIKCEKDKIEVPGKVDFILAFYMVHEVPDKDNFFKQLKSFLKENGKILIIEPPLHVTKKDFKETLKIAQNAGLSANAGPKLFLNHSAVLT